MLQVVIDVLSWSHNGVSAGLGCLDTSLLASPGKDSGVVSFQFVAMQDFLPAQELAVILGEDLFQTLEEVALYLIGVLEVFFLHQLFD